MGEATLDGPGLPSTYAPARGVAVPAGSPHEAVGHTYHQERGVGRVIVRDARLGPDPALVTGEGGEVLHEFESDRIYDLGDRLVLPDGTQVKVIGFRETFADEHTQVLMIGNIS